MCKRICGACKIEFPETTEFFATRKRKRKNKIEFQWQCKQCQKKYRKFHYENNKQKYILKAKINRQKSVDNFQDFKRTLKCNRCEESRWWLLDFHHTDPDKKEGEISFLLRKVSKEKLFEEISKCEVLCSNCHRDLHYKENHAVHA